MEPGALSGPESSSQGWIGMHPVEVVHKTRQVHLDMMKARGWVERLSPQVALSTSFDGAHDLPGIIGR